MSIDIFQTVTEKVLNHPNESNLREINLAILYEIKGLKENFNRIDERVQAAEQKITEHEKFKTENIAYYRSTVVFSAIISFVTTLLVTLFIKDKT